MARLWATLKQEAGRDDIPYPEHNPVKIKKVDGYRVSTPKGVKAKNTTLEKAKSQERLLNAVEHGWRPTGKKKKK